MMGTPADLPSYLQTPGEALRYLQEARGVKHTTLGLIVQTLISVPGWEIYALFEKEDWSGLSTKLTSLANTLDNNPELVDLASFLATHFGQRQSSPKKRGLGISTDRSDRWV